MTATPRLVPLLFHDVYENDPRESGFASQAADRYKLSVAEFEQQLASLVRLKADATTVTTPSGAPVPSANAQTAVGAAQTVVGSGFNRTFLITVDDGGVSYYTQVADRLEAHGWRGHCFVTTDYIGQHGFLTASQIRELDARGHIIGSHTASHPYRLHTCAAERVRREWADSRRALEDIVGHRVGVASVPGGCYSRAVAESAADAGIDMLFTSEPVIRPWPVAPNHAGIGGLQRGCVVRGRFTLRAGCDSNAAANLVGRAPWARCAEWTAWNAKGLLKPVLGRTYPKLADWVSARTASRV